MAEVMDRVWMAGESEKFAELVERHSGLVYAIALSILRNRCDAEDAAQTCFLRLMRHRWRLAVVNEERAFIARIAQRSALDMLRSRKGEESLEEHDAVSGRSPQEETDLARELGALVKAIRSLPEDLRRVMELQQSGELTSEEIGRVLGIPAATVRSRTARAKQLLREKLERRRS